MDDTFRQAIADAKLALELFRDSLGLFKSAKDLMPESSEKTAAATAIAEAERHARIAEAGLAASLGFPLCRKCWPPVVLPATAVHRSVMLFQCPGCQTRYKTHSRQGSPMVLEQLPKPVEHS